MAMDLPKGIVVNRPGISDDVERINEQPVTVDTIAHFWRVYTTTQRTLRDPTAKRLENYWWRIWGSRQRELRGATVAKLFLYISDGHTFNGRPLLSKVRRFEGDFTIPRIQNGGNVSDNNPSEPSRTSNVRPSSSSRSSKKPTVTMPHSILKKSTGSPSTGPHPTTRFVSPHGSEDESEKKGSISPNAHVVVRPPTPELAKEKKPQKTLKVPSAASRKKGKGHVVAAVAGRRRPAVGRRKSSHSSTERSTPEKPTSRTDDKEESGDETEREATTQDALPRASSTQGTEKYSKRGGFQQLKPHGSNLTDILTKDARSLGNAAGPGPSSQHNASKSSRFVATMLDESELNEDQLKELELQKLLLAEANARVEGRRPAREGSQVLRQNTRSVSLSNLNPAREATVSANVKGKASAVPRFTEVLGELGHPYKAAEPKNIDKGKGRDEGNSNLQFPKIKVPSLTAKDPSLQKIANPSSVSKSQSQIALLLQQDKNARTHETSSQGRQRDTRKLVMGSGSDDTQDEGLQMPLRMKKKRSPDDAPGV